MSNVVAIMGRALDEELQAHGVFSVGRQSCEEIIASIIERIAQPDRNLQKVEKLSSQPAPKQP